MRDRNRSVEFVNNAGGGFADDVEIPAGRYTIREFFEDNMPSEASANDFRIKVNGVPVAGDYQLQHADAVSVTPLKIEGAR